MTIVSTREPSCLMTKEDEKLLFSSAEMTVTTPDTNDKNHKKSSSSPSPSLSKKKKKTVDFFETVGVRATLHLCNITQEEIMKTWYSREEMSDIKSIVVDDLRKILSGVAHTTSMGVDNFTVRGLEYCIEQQQQNRCGGRSKSNSIHAVLDEQDKQYYAGYCTYDDGAIRDAYLEETIEYSMQARMLGRIDEVEATMIYNNKINTKNINHRKRRGESFTQNNNNNNTTSIDSNDEDEDCSISSLEEELPSFKKAVSSSSLV